MKKLPQKKINHYVQKNLGLIKVTIKKYFSWTGVITEDKSYRYCLFDYDDLFQEGVFGLIEAVKRFDKKKKNRFGTFAVYWIRQKIQHAIMERGGGLMKFSLRSHNLKRQIDSICAKENLSYYDLFEKGLINIKKYKLMNLMSEPMNYVDIEEVGPYIYDFYDCKSNAALKKMIKEEDEKKIKELIRRIVKKIFIRSHERNEFIINLKVGLNHNLDGKALNIKKITELTRKKFKEDKNLKEQQIGFILRKFFSFMKKILKRKNLTKEKLWKILK